MQADNEHFSRSAYEYPCIVDKVLSVPSDGVFEFSPPLPVALFSIQIQSSLFSIGHGKNMMHFVGVIVHNMK